MSSGTVFDGTFCHKLVSKIYNLLLHYTKVDLCDQQITEEVMMCHLHD